MRHASTRIFSSLICIFGIISCTGENQSSKAPEVPAEIISIIHSPDIRQVMDQSIASFYNQNLRLPNGAPLRIERLETSATQAVREISRGETKTVMWIAPMPALAEQVNNNLVNLGARQVECKKIFSTPLVAAMDRATSLKIFPANERPSRAAIVAGEPARVINIPRADMSDSGLLALLYLERQQREATPIAADQVLSFRTYGDIPHLMNGLSTGYFGVPRVALTTEQAVIHHNKAGGDPAHIIDAIYPADSAPELEYVACISEADWLSPAQKAGALMLQKHLLSQEPQIAAQRSGFRAVQYDTDTIGSFTRESGVLPVVPVVPEPVTAALVDSVLKNTSLISPPVATMYVIDTSASMQGAPITTIKRLVRVLLEKDDRSNLAGVISFDANVRLLSPPTDQRSSLYPYVLGLETDGGSSIYDAILLAAEQLGADKFKNMQRRIILFTDGNDQSSRTVLSFFGSAFERRANGREVALNTFLLRREGIDSNDLKQITSILGGTLHEYQPNITPEDLGKLVRKN